MSKPTLDNLFNSKVRVKILKFIFRNYSVDFSIKELSKKIKESFESTKKEVNLLKEIDLLKRIN